jgi:hypothetical protein
MFLKSIAQADASGPIAEIYAEERKELGLVMSATTCWTTEAKFDDDDETFREAVTVGRRPSPEAARPSPAGCSDSSGRSSSDRTSA